MELNCRTVKSTLQMDQSDAKSSEMVCKEFNAGIMAYNLVRGLMAAAAAELGGRPVELSFSKWPPRGAFPLAKQADVS